MLRIIVVTVLFVTALYGSVTDDACAEEPKQRMKLFQYDPVEIGHVHYVSDESGRIMEVVTVSVDPPVFEIQNFLSDEECDHVIKLALETGLEASGVVMELLPSLSDGNEDEIRVIFEQLDADEDAFLNPAEYADGLMDVAEGVLSDNEARLIMAEFNMDSNEDDLLDFEEFKLSWTSDMEKSVNEWVKKKHASNDSSFQFSKTRVSDQTWLDQTWHDDDTLIRLHERVIKLTQLPRDIVISSESLQVVRYKPGGHYHAHFDSCEIDEGLTCSHTADEMSTDDNVIGGDLTNDDATGGDVILNDATYQEESMDRGIDGQFDSKTQRLCRYATVLFYLNDVEEGGETAFPIADNETFSYEGLDGMPYDVYDLSYHCYDCNLVVKPKKGKAIFWYNHMVNKSTDWMGDVYNTSLHGGCDVRKGEKWIANNWVNVDDIYERQIEFQEYFKTELEFSKKAAEAEAQPDSTGETTDQNTENVKKKPDDSEIEKNRDEL